MKINEVEQLLNITKPNIRFYEKKGLLSPTRNANGYREYAKEDIETLKKIILLRKIGVSIDDIKAFLDGKERLSDIVDKNIVQIEEQMKELQGALHISQKMQRDQELDRAFNLDKYWDAMETDEQQGSKFFDVVKDYMEFESDIFFGMWSNIFFVDFKGLTVGKKYVISLFIVALICLMRGLAYHFIWKLGSVTEGAIYPFGIFFIISVMVLPLYVLNKKFSSEKVENEGVTTDSKGYLGVGFVFVLMLIGVFFFVPVLVEEFYLNRINADIHYVSASLMSVPYMLVAVYFIITINWLISKNGLFTGSIKSGKGFVCYLPKNIRIIVAVITLVLYFITTVLYATCYDQIDDNGFKKHRVFATTNYTYEDVKYYQLYANSDGTLGLFFRLSDGSKMEYYKDVSSYNVDDTEEYIIEVIKKLNSLGAKCRVPDKEELYKKLTYDYWDQIAEQILEVAEIEKN